MKYIFSLVIIFSYIISIAQPTVGVLSKTDEALEGYTFFSPFSGTKAYIVDNCGNLINQWDRGTRPGLSAYFLDNGLMFRTYKTPLEGPFTSASNAGGLELMDWDNDTVWRYEINTATQLSHHDAVMMPNGNILVLTWELTYRDELVSLGRDPNEIAGEDFMWSEKILELEPVGTNDANIIWQWHINDHYIQDLDDTKLGFGVVSEHPELFDINLPDLNSSNSNATRDWNHFNAIDYNSDLDQILLSVRNSDEIWILDHSTTIEEAASHEGGTNGKGGDILYRWGNPSAYKAAPISDQQLFGQHGVNWIDEGLEDAGKILIFNNGNGQPGMDFTQIEILDPTQDSLGHYTFAPSQPFGPDEANTIYGDKTEERFYSAFLSNAYRLTNGNTLINAGSPGRIFEVTPNDDIAWEYEIPLFGDTPANQGQNVSNNGNFRAYKFPIDYSGFDGLDLTPGLPIENNPLECELSVSTDEVDNLGISVIHDSNAETISIEGNFKIIDQLRIINNQGQVLREYSLSELGRVVSIEGLGTGIYYAVLRTVDSKVLTKKIVVVR